MAKTDDVLLVDGLNSLLKALGITIVVTSSLDLTPTLLIAMLESIIQERLPLAAQARECRTRTGRIEAMKAFLGVLGDDIMRRDLADIDPRRLAEGGHEETTLVAQLLCALAGDMDTVSIASSVAGSSTMTYSRATETWTVPTTAQSCTPESSFLFSSSSDGGDGSTIVFGGDTHNPSTHSFGRRDQRPIPSAVRYEGWIKPVEGDIEAFESSRFAVDALELPTSASSASTLPVTSTRHTLFLLQERARLLMELAKINRKQVS